MQYIHNEPKQNYGAPKIIGKPFHKGETVSERTVKQMEIKAQRIKPWTRTTIDSDFSNELQNILDKQFAPSRSNAVWYCVYPDKQWLCLSDKYYGSVFS